VKFPLAAVLSHWFLDVIVHIPDLPLTPFGDFKVGMGLWNYDHHIAGKYYLFLRLLCYPISSCLTEANTNRSEGTGRRKFNRFPTNEMFLSEQNGRIFHCPHQDIRLVENCPMGTFRW